MGNRATITVEGSHEAVAYFYTHNDAAPEVMLPVLGAILAGSLCESGSAPNIVAAILTAPGVEIEGGKQVDPKAPDTVRLDLQGGRYTNWGEYDQNDVGHPMHDLDARYTIRPRINPETGWGTIGWELIVEEAKTYGNPTTTGTYTNAAEVFAAAAEQCRSRANWERHLMSREGGFYGARPDVWEADAERLDGEAIVAGLLVSA